MRKYYRDINETCQVVCVIEYKLKPYLLDLKKTGNFTQYRLWNVSGFRSIYSIRIYQLLKEHHGKRIRHFEFEVNEFRMMILGGNLKIYPAFKDLRRRVLDTAQKELNEKDKTTGFYKTDLNFTLETRRTSRKISHLVFTIKTQQTKPAQIQAEPQQTANDNTPQIILAYEAFGVMRKMVKPYLDQRGEQALQNTLNKFHHDKENGKISKSEQGYLAYLLRVNAGQETAQDKERQQKEVNQQHLKEKEAQEQILKTQFHQQREAELKAFFASVPDEELEYIIADFEKSELFKRHIQSLLVLFDLYQKFGMQDPDIKNYFNVFIINQYLDKSLNYFEQWKEKQSV